MHITKFGIAGFGPFGHPIFQGDDEEFRERLAECFRVECDKRVNLFIGGNGTGKTTILRAFHYLYTRRSDEAFFDQDPCYGWLEASEDWPGGHRSGAHTMERGSISDRLTNWQEVPILYIPATRVNLPVAPLVGNAPVPEASLASGWREPWDGYRYRGNLSDGRRDHRFPFGPLFETDTGVFYGHHVETAADELGQRLMHGQNPEPINQLRSAINLGYTCAKTICSEMIEDPTPHPYTSTTDVLLRAPYEDDIIDTMTFVHQGMGIGTSDRVMGEPMYAGNLSSGTQGTLLWVRALALEIAYHYDWQEGWQNKPAILLIDEIENHLHPTWQRRVIPALLEHFPALQIFATTHSPFVVAGLKAGQVHRMYRNPEGDFLEIETNQEDLIGLTSDAISRKYLEIVDPTDLATANATEELRRLRDEGTRADALQEDQRQKRMLELRELVNRNMLAGGPRAAQRELFEEQVAQELEKYRRSQNLN